MPPAAAGWDEDNPKALPRWPIDGSWPGWGESRLLPVTSIDLRVLTASRPILLSDDTPAMLSLYRVILQERRGLAVVGTTDPYETLDLCRTRPFSLVVSDIMKPGIDGLEMLRRLRADPAMSYLPFMFATARSCSVEDLTHGGTLADDYLIKPFSPHEFLWRVERLLLRWTEPPLSTLAGFD